MTEAPSRPSSRTVWPLGVLAIGAALTAVIMAARWYYGTLRPADMERSPEEEVWRTLHALLYLSAPWLLLATGLWLSRSNRLYPWVKTQALIVVALGLVCATVVTWGALTATGNDMGEVFLIAGSLAIILLVQCFLALRTVIFTMRLRWGEKGPQAVGLG